MYLEFEEWHVNKVNPFNKSTYNIITRRRDIPYNNNT